MSSPSSLGLFPSGPTSPNAFTLFHQSPRETHDMYAALTATTSSSSPPSDGRARSSSSSSTLTKLWRGRNKGSKA
ncbi:uncharacterized protein SCHCODRAFT_02663757 [Schizophyllum commune H4-8]|uniref:uncharacterized protein n=1 Tax=Schizophyllum commune (strain H4-8 / FGSC 9210) TaxID=578458 RepID=UPI002160E535|nr:uncharacterized protein SCHCODRAFT_02663757 [Schizophyllum commune H4-8]KAI5898931.1 hypothetical protein SCHCODRAFT_02663757 [Schizophyllum commune H4-8]